MSRALFQRKLSSRQLSGVHWLVYLAAALWSTWPLARQATVCLPLASMTVGAVPLFNVWTIWWNADRLTHGFQSYWTAPIFYPVADTFAFSEPQPLTLLVAPVIWLTGSRILAYNVYLWLSLVLNGVFAERLLRRLGIHATLSAAGGLALLLLPAVHWQLDVIQLVPLWGILWTWEASSRAGRAPTLSRGAEVGLAFAAAFLTCGHQGLFLSFLLPCTAWILIQRGNVRHIGSSVCAAGFVAALMIGPLVWHMRQALDRDDFQRQAEIVAQLSANASDYLACTGQTWLGQKSNRGLNPGWFKVGLAACGLVFGTVRRRWRRWTIFLTATGILAFLLSLGPNLHLGTWQPWWTLTAVWPGFAHVRNVFRFAFFVQMVTVLLAAQGLHAGWILSRLSERSRRRITRAAIMLAGLIMIFEVQPGPIVLFHTPHAEAQSGWITYLHDHVDAGSGVACFPFPDGDSVADFENETRWMYYGTFHGRPLINGYSGFFPDEFTALQDALLRGFPSGEVCQMLHRRRVKLLVINRNVMVFPSTATLHSGEFTLERVFQDPAGIDVYRLAKDPN